MNPCLCSATRRASRSLTRLYEDHLREANVTPPQFYLLSLLLQRPGLSQQELATKLDLDQTTLSRNLKLLLANRWIKRSASSTDARLTLYTLTTTGTKTRAVALPHWQQAQQHMQRALGADAPQALALLERLTAAAA